MNRFIGRQREIELLHRLRNKSTSSLIVVWGRRRIGKSRLIAEFIRQEGVKGLTFTGLPPEQTVSSVV